MNSTTQQIQKRVLDALFEKIKEKPFSEKVKDFDNWMLKMKNVHYGNNARMYNAYKRL